MVFQNTTGAHVNGFETELDGRFPGGLQGRASYSYTDDQNALTTQSLTNSPHRLAKLNVIAPMLQQKLFAGLEAQFNSRATTLEGGTASSFQVFNATLLGHAMGKHLDVSASAYNLLDKKYFDPAPAGLTQDQIQQDGRNFRAHITAKILERMVGAKRCNQRTNQSVRVVIGTVGRRSSEPRCLEVS